MIFRKTNFYYAPIRLVESLYLLCSSLIVLLKGNNSKNTERNSFEASWKNITGAVSTIATPSARAGLFMILEALSIGKDDEVIVTGFTCEAVPEPILFKGAKPIYIDIDPISFCIQPDLVVEAINENTKVIIIQHTLGLPAKTKELIDIANQYNLFVIEDCALALGSKYNGQLLGKNGDASIFSFELSKTITAGWGGVVQINNNMTLAERIRCIRDNVKCHNRFVASSKLFQAGLSGLLYHPYLAPYSGRLIAILFLIGLFGRSATKGIGNKPPESYLFSPSDYQWRVLCKQLARIENAMEVRGYISLRYQSILNNLKCVVEVPFSKNGTRLIRFPLLVKDRDRATEYFMRSGIEIGRWFSQPVSTSTGRNMSQYGYKVGSCPISEFVSKHIINLPMHERMNEYDINMVEQCLYDYLSSYPDEREFVTMALNPKKISELLTQSQVIEYENTCSAEVAY